MTMASSDAEEYPEEMEMLKFNYAEETLLTSNSTGHVELPIILHHPLQLIARADATQQPTHSGHQSVSISHLPPVRASFRLPPDYPQTAAPEISIHVNSGWMPDHVVTELESMVTSLWEELDHTYVLCA
jgi:hypothetical protein